MKRVDIKEITRKLNTARMEAGDYKFENRKEIQEYLTCYDLKVGSKILFDKLYSVMFKDNKFLPDPIYIEKVKAIYDSVNEYVKNHRTPKEVNSVESQKESQEHDSIQAAIELLKQNGYRVLKPVTEYKEV